MLSRKCNYTTEDQPYCVMKFVSRYDPTCTFGFLVISRVKVIEQDAEDCFFISYQQYILEDKQFIDSVLSRQDTKIIVYNI